MGQSIPTVGSALTREAYARSREAGTLSAGKMLYGLALVAAIILALGSLLPLYWMVVGSFKLQSDAMSVPPEFWPQAPTLANWIKLLTRQSLTWRWFLNSLIVSIGVTVSATFTSACAGYVFGKKNFPGRTFLFWLVIITMMLPKQISLIPLFILMRNFGWINTYQGMVAPWIAYPFGIFLIKQYMSTIPNELIDAARIDGADEIRIFTRVIVPLTKPAIGALAIFAFMAGWNDYIWQLIMVTQPPMLTLPIGVSKLVTSMMNFDLGLAMAGATFAFIPMLVVFVLFQDYFVKGITMGSIKG